MSALPAQEARRLKGMHGSALRRIRLCLMRDCGEEFVQATGGFACTTWGVLLGFDAGSLFLTWGDDAHGDPYRVAVLDDSAPARVDSLVLQDVTHLEPWTTYVGRQLDGSEVPAYESNYGNPPKDRWHAVPWGVVLHFGTRRLLVAAAHHSDPKMPSPCADEMVVAFDNPVIDGLRATRAAERSEWKA